MLIRFIVAGVVGLLAVSFYIQYLVFDTSKEDDQTPTRLPLEDMQSSSLPSSPVGKKRESMVEISLTDVSDTGKASITVPSTVSTSTPVIAAISLATTTVMAELPPSSPSEYLGAEGPPFLPSPPAVVKGESGPLLPALNEEALLRAVVKIQCQAKNNQGIYVGSAFVLSSTTVVTAAHVVMNSATTTCDVIFPSERKPIHYLRGVTEDLAVIKKRHDEKGVDVATLALPPLNTYPEARAIFESYPAIPYPICGDPAQLGDALLHFGYPSNYKDQSYLSKLDGEVAVFADIDGVEDQLSLDQTVVYKTPIFSYTNDELRMHPYIVSRVPSFYGDSGGLAFNKTKQCILGPHRGGTIGKADGENYTVFMNVGWEWIKDFLGRQ